jgi:hypothetical protein
VVRQKLVAYFRLAMSRGELAIDDLDLAAEQFQELCKADLHNRVIFGIGRDGPRPDTARTIRGAVDVFLARYGTAPR